MAGKSKSDDENALANHIRGRLRDHIFCTVFENTLSGVWPRPHEHDCRIKEIEAFAKANGWTVTISDPGIRLTFKKLKVNQTDLLPEKSFMPKSNRALRTPKNSETNARRSKRKAALKD
jgi:hypothetical protein